MRGAAPPAPPRMFVRGSSRMSWVSMNRARSALVVAVAALAVYVLLPFRVSDYWLSVLNLAGIAAIGAAGLNLLTGYCGQLSLGHAAFLGTGAYVCAAL